MVTIRLQMISMSPAAARQDRSEFVLSEDLSLRRGSGGLIEQGRDPTHPGTVGRSGCPRRLRLGIGCDREFRNRGG